MKPLSVFAKKFLGIQLWRLINNQPETRRYKLMKYYSLSAVVNSEPVTIHKHFETREEAISYMFDFLNNKYIYKFLMNYFI